MTRWKRLFYYLMVNILVSACTIVSVLLLWERFISPDASSLRQAPAAVPTSWLASLDFEDEITPSPQPSPTPTRALVAYRVAAGDTLSEIAESYSVTTAELMVINGMDNPDALASGQVLFVPAPVETPAPSTPVPSAAAEAGEQVKIEIKLVIGAGDLPTERVRIEKEGDANLSLVGWQLSGGEGKTFTFPQLVLFQQAAVDIYTKKGVNSAVSLYWGLDQPAWKPGETIRLMDAGGVVQSEIQVP
jgi:LysM repeat protein